MTRPPDFEIPPAAREAWTALATALEDTTTPCTTKPDTWFAEDPETRQEAAEARLRCPVLEPCARSHPDPTRGSRVNDHDRTVCARPGCEHRRLEHDRNGARQMCQKSNCWCRGFTEPTTETEDR